MISFPDIFPILQTPRLRLDRICEADLPRLLYLRNNPQTMRYIDRPVAETIEDAKVLWQQMETGIENKQALSWGLYVKGSTELIGFIGYWRAETENFRSEIGYMIAPEFEGKGLMSEALLAALQYGFGEMKLHSVVADINPSNERSKSLLLKFHFQREAYFRENIFYNGAFIDTEIYTMLKRDFNPA